MLLNKRLAFHQIASNKMPGGVKPIPVSGVKSALIRHLVP
jgi:hypothetical protein